ncbi:hypothetical protein [Azospirillum griseum]|uniref:PilZ domain-containing protein n=1 Tax=Azospirillum griseum TaxID=2496639 RepID=A0A431VPB4_9PROT|nr:hypothetical protein [Azospirillum griseum]RTR24616.1 hypothetical protein EJ903_02370 [Azospirillum griseum]
MPKFDLYVVRPPAGMATVTAIPEGKQKQSEVTLRNLSRSGCMVKSLGDIDLSFVKKSEAQIKIEFAIRTMFAASTYKPPVSIVW